MGEISNNLETKENCASKYNWYGNTENMPPNEQNIKFLDHVERVSDEFDEGGEHLNEDEVTITDINSYDLQDSDTARADIGEPLTPQYISIDFTPVHGVDDVESLQEKCLGFWKFVNGNPTLQRLSDKGLEEVHSLTMETNTNIPTNRSDSYNSVNQTIHVFKNVAHVTRTIFETKQSCDCQNHDDDYLSGEVQKQNPRQVKLKKRYNGRVGQQSLPELKSEMSLSNRLSRTSCRVPDEVDKLCREMKNWDILHPKSMKQPQTVKFDA
ncbi:uncharacterized protein LOC116775294 isoform X1 [Danaus plexippus]|uniref:uncharacterized protein LOC116775294 isoform X1 n=1 Tax=Danaus plexippus TaxID=13037 RepID=UPI002AB072DA|nr:uncharacterized protein LOC116775294 isoform X1 [Danaus plexippus]